MVFSYNSRHCLALQLLLLLYILKFSLCESFFFGALISLRVQKKRIELILIHIPVVKGRREKRSLTRKFGDVSYPLAKKPRGGGGGGGESKASKITIQWMIHQGPGPSLNHVARNNTPASAYNICVYARCVHAFHSFEEEEKGSRGIYAFGYAQSLFNDTTATYLAYYLYNGPLNPIRGFVR